MNPATLRALVDSLEASARLARALIEEGPGDPGDHLSLAEAATIARTSIGVVKAAIRGKQLAGYGGQRDRSVKRGELTTWLADRSTRAPEGPADDDIGRRMRRLAQKQH